MEEPRAHRPPAGQSETDQGAGDTGEEGLHVRPPSPVSPSPCAPQCSPRFRTASVDSRQGPHSADREGSTRRAGSGTVTRAGHHCLPADCSAARNLSRGCAVLR